MLAYSSTMDHASYDRYVESMRREQYPMLKDALYLDQAGTALPSRSLLDRAHTDMLANLYGNPHSASPSSLKSTHKIEDVRLRLLKFFNADPDEFDLVFTANATAGIKLVADSMRDLSHGFWYGYHADSHTSLIGVREVAKQAQCFEDDAEVERWIETSRMDETEGARLFAYPAQSNMNGRRLPMDWLQGLNSAGVRTLLDAAAYASTSQLDLSNSAAAADFTVVSLYKIFGFPDLGALIVKKDCAPLFQKRRFFGGGTVDMVVCIKEQWHEKKIGALHERLEDGTLPVHSIVALDSALQTHHELFGSMERISHHTTAMTWKLQDRLQALRHANGTTVCVIYSNFDRSPSRGPIVAFNLRDSKDAYVSATEVEKIASLRNIHLRTGGVCNPGGVATSLGLAPWELRDNFSAGHRCGGEVEIVSGKPTGVIRVSLGATSTFSDVDRFIDFIDEYFVDKSDLPMRASPFQPQPSHRLQIESLTVYPIKSCAGWAVPFGIPWDVRREGLAWDREWCIVHEGTGAALSQKHHPRMALVKPSLDFKSGKLHIRLIGQKDEIAVPLSMDSSFLEPLPTLKACTATVCGDEITARRYLSPTISDALTDFLGVPCTLARFPPASAANQSARHSKVDLQSSLGRAPNQSRPLLLSNESPILTITRSSLNALNEVLKARGFRAAHPYVFRANIVLSELPHIPPGAEEPWSEDGWSSLRILSTSGGESMELDVLGGCRRCQMVCVDQETAGRKPEVFLTLAKLRRIGGKVLFGIHGALGDGRGRVIKVGDVVEAVGKGFERDGPGQRQH